MLLWFVLLLVGVLPVPVGAATLPSGFTETRVASGLSAPTAMAFAPDGRLFVAEQNGRLRVIKNGSLLSAPFLTVSVDSSGERGLLGVAFDPNFATNQFVYVYYTVPSSPRHNRVSRFTAAGDVAAAGSERIILELPSLSGATNHNGGALHFGPDGKLYVAVGDNANSANAQTLTSRMGKLLRLNPDGTLPADNPFSQDRAIYARGLRNPFTFAFQPGTGRMFINDVGEARWEEVNEGEEGANYGWPTCEGECNNASFRNPIYSYDHDQGCAIIGGAFYNPAVAQFPAQYVGKYFFGDLCGGSLHFFDPDSPPARGNASTFATGLTEPLVGLEVGPDGSLYRLMYEGEVWRMQFTGSQAPSITQQPANRTVTAGQSASFSVAAAGSAPLTYQWQRNGTNITGANAPTFSTGTTTASDHGARFRCVVRNAHGTATSNDAVLTVTSNRAPTATITQPANGTPYAGGQTFTYAGTGSDPEDGTVPASRFTWQIDLHHDTHTHPFMAATTGATSGSFTIPTTGHTETNVWYRITLTVRDSGGLPHSTFVDVRPRTVTLSLASTPPGLRVTLDGQPVTTPHSAPSVVGVMRTLGPVSPQTLNGTPHTFSAWAHGGAATQTLPTPTSNTTFTASYQSGAAGKASITSPAAGATLPGASATFTWDAVGGALEYFLYVGTSAGGNNLYGASQGTGRSQTVSGLPTDGSTVHVRLWTRLAGGWDFTDATFRAATGIATQKAAITSPAAGSTLPGASATFNWSAGTGALEYFLYVGTAAGANDLYAASQGTDRSQTVSGLPTNGATLHVRLWTRLASGWEFSDHTFRAATSTTGPSKAAITNPAPGATLPGATATFSWDAGNGALEYFLYVGTAAGANDVYAATQGTGRSQTVSGLPTNGATVFVRLWTRLATGWDFADFTYRAASATSGKAAITTPTPGSTLPGATVTFHWDAGTGALEYFLYVGTTGAGANNIYGASQGTNRSQTVASLPTNGSTVFVRLWTRTAAGWEFNDYTYRSR